VSPAIRKHQRCINVHTLQHIFTHPKGLHFATQLTQIALVVMSHAAFENQRSISPDAAFADHSLGGFSALTTIVDILPNSSLVDIVFYRGLAMQRAVERDEQGRSNYTMCQS
jgi:fatty acid synthase subunit beta